MKYTVTITAKISSSTSEIVGRLVKEIGSTSSEFVRIAIEEHVKDVLRTLLVDRFDEDNALSLIECMSRDSLDGVGVSDVVLGYRISGGCIVEATRGDIEDALSSVCITNDKDTGGVVVMQNGKVVINESDVLRVVQWDKKLGVLVIA